MLTIHGNCIVTTEPGVTKMAQHLRHAALAGPGSFPAPTRLLANAYNSSSRVSNALFWPLVLTCTYQLMQAHAYT